MIISELLTLHDGVAGILFASGMHCVGCQSASGETLEQAAAVHGMNADEIVDKINSLM